MCVSSAVEVEESRLAEASGSRPSAAVGSGSCPGTFDSVLRAHGLRLRRGALRTLQINVGRRCNQACRHCHVEAAPWRTEMLGEPVFRRIAEWIQCWAPPVVDLTGGAPELSEFFRPLVQVARAAGCHVIDRNNLTILGETGFADLPEFLAENGVEVVASLPCYGPENVNRQRGQGVFARSIAGLHRLNAVGYGRQLPLNLVYNPLGARLPGPQAELEADYRTALRRDFGLEFTSLYTLTNQPIARFAEDLRAQGKLEAYQELLLAAFNPGTVTDLMCRSTLSVSYEGRLHDCDFNQMLGLPLATGGARYLWEINPAELEDRIVQTGRHCFACTAGGGSSCTGALMASVQG